MKGLETAGCHFGICRNRGDGPASAIGTRETPGSQRFAALNRKALSLLLNSLPLDLLARHPAAAAAML
jgi:hypothetical protein